MQERLATRVPAANVPQQRVAQPGTQSASRRGLKGFAESDKGGLSLSFDPTKLCTIAGNAQHVLPAQADWTPAAGDTSLSKT